MIYAMFLVWLAYFFIWWITKTHTHRHTPHHNANLMLNEEKIMVHKGGKTSPKTKIKSRAKTSSKYSICLKLLNYTFCTLKMFVKSALKLLDHNTSSQSEKHFEILWHGRFSDMAGHGRLGQPRKEEKLVMLMTGWQRMLSLSLHT